MMNFTTYSNNIINDRIIDSHIHLFDARGETPLNHNIKNIGFMDIWFPELYKYENKGSEELYMVYINNGVSELTTLLATAPDPDQIIHIYENNKSYIKGFGELKCYDYSFANDKITKLDFKNLDWVEELCKYNKENLPIYIHYSLDRNNYKILEQLFKKYPNIPFILCHCGIGTDKEYGFSLQGDPFESFQLACVLAQLNNVFLEISYTAATWLHECPPQIFCSLLYNIHISKFVLGTDCNNYQFEKDYDCGCELYLKQKKYFLDLYKIFGNYNYINIRKLFK